MKNVVHTYCVIHTKITFLVCVTILRLLFVTDIFMLFMFTLKFMIIQKNEFCSPGFIVYMTHC
jgi:hypothetical protein